MFTYKFVGLKPSDAETPYYYGSLPQRPETGQVIQIADTGTFYRVNRVSGEGLKGRGGKADQETLAWAEIGGGEDVPTLFLSPLLRKESVEFHRYVEYKSAKTPPKTSPKWSVNFMKKAPEPPIPAKGKSYEAEEFKHRSRYNRRTRLSQKPPKS